MDNMIFRSYVWINQIDGLAKLGSQGLCCRLLCSANSWDGRNCVEPRYQSKGFWRGELPGLCQQLGVGNLNWLSMWIYFELSAGKISFWHSPKLHGRQILGQRGVVDIKALTDL